MSSAPPDAEVSLPILLRRAHQAYGLATETALVEAGFDDIPENGRYVLGGLARRKGNPLSQLIAELGISKQAAGQLVDTLVLRGYLRREVDAADRRRLTISLTERGVAAAKVLGAARAAVDATLASRASAALVDAARQVLTILATLHREQRARVTRD